MNWRHIWLRWVLFSGLCCTIILFATCSSINEKKPSTTPDPIASSLTDDVQSVNTQRLLEVGERISSIRGLDPPEDPPEFSFITREQFKGVLVNELLDEQLQEDLRVSEAFYKMLGMLPAESDYREIYKTFLSAGVAGYYDPDDKQFRVLSSSSELDSADESTFAHEYIHLLQDLHFDLTRFDDVSDQSSDYLLAVRSVVEGDAVFTEGSYSQSNSLFPTQDRREAERQRAEVLEGLKNVPNIVILVETIPYSIGPQFIAHLVDMNRGGYEEVNKVLLEPPISTEQVMHPEKYFTKEPPIQVEVNVDILGDGWTETDNDVLGEMFLFAWLLSLSPDSLLNQLAFLMRLTDAVSGWGGDAVSLAENSEGEWAMAGLMVWDNTDTDAEQFLDALLEGIRDSGSVTLQSLSQNDLRVTYWESELGILGIGLVSHPLYGLSVAYASTPSLEGTMDVISKLAQS